MNWTKRILTQVRFGTKGPESKVSPLRLIHFLINCMSENKLRVLKWFILLSKSTQDWWPISYWIHTYAISINLKISAYWWSYLKVHYGYFTRRNTIYMTYTFAIWGGDSLLYYFIGRKQKLRFWEFSFGGLVSGPSNEAFRCKFG